MNVGSALPHKVRLISEWPNLPGQSVTLWTQAATVEEKQLSASPTKEKPPAAAIQENQLGLFFLLGNDAHWGTNETVKKNDFAQQTKRGFVLLRPNKDKYHEIPLDLQFTGIL